MRKSEVFFHGIPAGVLEEIQAGKAYRFLYHTEYAGEPVSLTMPANQPVYKFDRFPPFFEGVLPEGMQLEALLKIRKIDRNDLFSQLLAVRADLVGAATVWEME